MKTLFDTPDERHAFIIGFCELLPPWPAYEEPWYKGRHDVGNEYHYYRSGRTCGAITLIFLLALVKKLFWS